MRALARQVLASAGVCAVLAAGGAAATGWFVARKLTAPVAERRHELNIRAVEQDGDTYTLVLDRTTETTRPGIYHLWFKYGGWAQLGSEIQGRGPTQIARVITGRSENLTPQPGDRVSWSGIYYATPRDAGLEARDIMITTSNGPAPAWRIDGNTSIWAVHIHGLGSTRAGTLRGVQVATDLGYTSLVVSYRNDSEGPRVANGRSTLGLTEGDDVDAAIGYAVRRGAEKIVLFGWSMGASIALHLAHRVQYRMQYRGLIVALVLESPVLDWADVIKANCKRAGLTEHAGRLAMPWLTTQPLAQLLGLPCAVPFDEMNWVERAYDLEVPTLILHGTQDDSVPISAARSTQRQRPDRITLESFDAGHTLNWNVEPALWRDTVTKWLTEKVRS